MIEMEGEGCSAGDAFRECQSTGFAVRRHLGTFRVTGFLRPVVRLTRSDSSLNNNPSRLREITISSTSFVTTPIPAPT